MESFCSLRQKEVINIRDGFRFGFIEDIDIDIRNGKVTRLILPAGGGLFSLFGKDKEYRIPWGCICKIGEDIILVDVCIDDVLEEGC